MVGALASGPEAYEALGPLCANIARLSSQEFYDPDPAGPRFQLSDVVPRAVLMTRGWVVFFRKKVQKTDRQKKPDRQRKHVV